MVLRHLMPIAGFIAELSKNDYWQIHHGLELGLV
jgi:hypothetical protein